MRNSQTKKLADLTGMKYYGFAQACTLEEGTFGNGFLSRIPITDCSVIHIPEKNVDKSVMFYEMRCILKAKLANGFNVLVTHFGLSEKEHINAVEAIMENLEEEKCILMGDFNLPPNSELLKPIYEKMKDTSYYGCENKKSWPSDKPEIKIDYIFVSPDIEVISADIPEITASDHRPHVAEVN